MLEDSSALIMIVVMIMVMTIVVTLTMIAITSWNAEEHPRTHYPQPSTTYHRTHTFFLYLYIKRQIKVRIYAQISMDSK